VVRRSAPIRGEVLPAARRNARDARPLYRRAQHLVSQRYAAHAPLLRAADLGPIAVDVLA
jgi:hypothetical protein